MNPNAARPLLGDDFACALVDLNLGHTSTKRHAVRADRDPAAGNDVAVRACGVGHARLPPCGLGRGIEHLYGALDAGLVVNPAVVEAQISETLT
jgi:hypothetical protein